MRFLLNKWTRLEICSNISNIKLVLVSITAVVLAFMPFVWCTCMYRNVNVYVQSIILVLHLAYGRYVARFLSRNNLWECQWSACRNRLIRLKISNDDSEQVYIRNSPLLSFLDLSIHHILTRFVTFPADIASSMTSSIHCLYANIHDSAWLVHNVWRKSRGSHMIILYWRNPMKKHQNIHISSLKISRRLCDNVLCIFIY